ncbi:hypothetical protein EMCRGX_G014513 [Ephydatia muelleri]
MTLKQQLRRGQQCSCGVYISTGTLRVQKPKVQRNFSHDLSGQVAGNETVMIPRAHDSNVDEAAVEYVAGAGASMVNIIVTFPLYKVMFRQQMEGLRLRRAMAQLHGEGLTNIFRGLLPPLIQRTMTVSIMFGSYWQYRGALHDLTPGLPRAVQHCLAAFSAGCTEALLTPLERIQVLLQLKESKLQNTYHAVRELRPHGLKEYYRGVSAIVLRNGISNVLFFSLREPIQKILPRPPDRAGGDLWSIHQRCGPGRSTQHHLLSPERRQEQDAGVAWRALLGHQGDVWSHLEGEGRELEEVV